MMQVEFRTRDCEVSEEDRGLVSRRIEHLCSMMVDFARAEAYFHHVGNPSINEKFECEVTVFGKPHVLRAHASGSEPVQAFDKAISKLTHQVEKLKGRLMARTHPHHRATKAFDPSETMRSLDGNIARIVKSKSFTIAPMSPEDAAFQMEMLEHGFYIFKNSETGKPAVVYQRDDGSVGLIDADV